MNEHQKFYKSVTCKVRTLRRKIGENIHDARTEQGVTLKKLADLSRLSPDTIDRLEMGKGEIDLMQIVRLSVALKVDINALFRDLMV